MEGLIVNNVWALALALLSVAIVILGARSVDNLGAARRRASVALRVGLVFLLALALADPRMIARTSERAVIGLIDISASVGDSAVAKAKAYLAEVRETPGLGVDQWLAFAREPLLLDDSLDLDALGLEKRDFERTSLSEALSFAEALLPPGKVQTFLLFSDGRGDIDFARAAARLDEAGVRIHASVVEPPSEGEILVRSVSAPNRVREKAPFDVETEIFSNRAMPAELKVFRNGVLARTEKVELSEGNNRFEFVENAGEERQTTLTVSVSAEGDTVIENNEAMAVVQTQGEAKVLLLADAPGRARYLSLALRQEGIRLEVRPGLAAPVEISDIQNYDLVVLDNVAANALSRDQMELMARYVRDFGGGFLMVGGDQSFGLGGFFRTPVDEILPLKSDFEKEREDPALGLTLVIDKSGSMSGAKIEMAKEAAKAAIELLSARDFAGVVVFDGQALWAAEMQPVVDKFGLEQMISSIQPGGGTNLSPAMELAFSQLSVSPAKLKHVIVLSDGHSQPGPFYELTSQMAQAQITVSTVGVGESADRALLEQIARWGNGRFYYTEEAQRIPQIFARETMTASKSAIRETPFQVVPVKRAPFVEDIDFEAAPFLYGYVITEAKPTAEVWLATEKGEPLLSTWRFGLGTAGAFTSDARNQWAVEWLRWEGYGPFWAQVFRYLMRSSALDPFPAAVSRQGDRLALALDAIDSRGEILADARAVVRLARPGGELEEFELEREGPGRLTVDVPAAESGAYHMHLEVRDAAGELLETQYLASTVGYPEEYSAQLPDVEGLSILAGQTGGTLNPTVGHLLNDGRAAQKEVELWPWFAGLALAVFLADVALRRWP